MTNQACHNCMIKADYKRKDKGFHTAELAKCSVCGEVKPILSSRHYIKVNK
jgi:hypothetical protein